jgi:Ran GTPase-activating protein (RanGAP) involved in mRNA processing and transport
VTETLAPVEIKKFISDHVEGGKWHLVFHVESGKWHLVLQFIAGILGMKIENFDKEYKDCVFAFVKSLKVTNGEIEIKYPEVFIMKCLMEVDNEKITKEVCEATAINDLVELRINKEFYNLSTIDWAAVTFVCKHMKKLANLSLFGWDTDCLPEILGLLRERCLNKLNMRPATFRIPDEVFSALMELNCALDHKHTRLTSLALHYLRMTEIGLPIGFKFFENEHASQLEQLTLNSNRIDSHEISKLCEVLNNGHCPNLVHLNLANNSIRDEGAMVLCDSLMKGLRNLKKLDVGMCSLTDQCIPSLCKALQDERCQLTVLSLGHNAIGDEGACLLFEDALTKEHCKLTELNLLQCSLTDQCIPSLCKVLKDGQCVLTILFLLSNHFTENGKKLLRDTLNYESCKARGLQINVWGRYSKVD